jgi:alkylated DNA repair dioxygenase AlkB
MRQDSLFPETPPSLIEGLRYEPGFLEPAAEAALLAIIETLPFHEARYKEYRAKRRIVSYGGSYDYDSNELLPAEPVPEFLHPLRERIAAWAKRPPEEFTHAMIAEYRAGTQLGWHRDVPNFERIVGVSLLGMARMRFRPYAEQARHRVFSLDLAPRSIYVLEGAARWDWQHSVVPTPNLRYSITFRTMRSGR